MTLQQLKYLVTVSEYGNISEAAKCLYVSQPTITSAIHSIEEEMHITAFTRSNKGVEITREGEVLLSYARQLLEQADEMVEHFRDNHIRKPHFSISAQHYSFVVNAFVDVIKRYDAEAYNFTLRETQTNEIIEDVALGRSEIGVLYLNQNNSSILLKLIQKNELVYQELYRAKPHVFLTKSHPLVQKEKITIADLQPYPYLAFEQGNRASLYFSEEIVSVLEFPKNIMVRDRATLFNLLIGLNGFTVSSGIIDSDLNGENIIARPLDYPSDMRIGIIVQKQRVLSAYGKTYIEQLRKHLPQNNI